MKSWINDVKNELVRARAKFPKPDYLLSAFSEESGELVKSVLDHMFEKATKDEVYAEAIQVIAMAVRIIEEGDPIHKLTPLIQTKEETQKSAFDEWLSNNYFCAANLRTNGNPRIDLMLNCKDFWFDEDGLIVLINRRWFPNGIKENSIPTSDGYYFIHRKEIGTILADFFQSQIVKYNLQEAKDIIEHFNEYCSVFANMRLEFNGYNHIRARRIDASNNRL